MKIKNLMTKSPHTVSPNLSIRMAQEKMRSFDCHHLPVLDGGQLIGVISDRDIKTVEKVVGGLDKVVQDVMTDEAYVVDPDRDIRGVVEEMLKEKINSVVVQAKNGEPWGIFTTTDALHYINELPINFD